MKFIQVAIVVLVVLVGGFFAFNSYIYNEKQADDAQYTTLSDAETDLLLQYRAEPEGYVLQTLEKDSYTDPAFVRQYTLITKTDYEWMQQNTEASEGPPSIGVAIFRNLQNESASVWTDAHPELSNVGLIVGAANRDAVVGGANATRFLIDGLYRTDIAVVAHGGFVFVFSGAFLDEASAIRRDFNNLIDSVSFSATLGQ